ncbi:MAG: CDP-diacylglycerol--glycerol-3-phosphate 3-phosphatidyltransferase [Vicinamibacterales bacterium]
MNLPNTLTVARIFLVPLLVVVLLTEFDGLRVAGLPKEPLAAAIFALASITDWLDGYLARRRHQVTTLGQLLDPLADKLLVSGALVSLVQLDLAPAWIVALILGRELAVTGLRGLAHNRGVTIAASGLGKLKMATEVVAILALMLSRQMPWLLWVGHLALWVVAAVAVYSGVDYYRRFNYVLNPKIADFASAAAERAERRRVAGR